MDFFLLFSDNMTLNNFLKMFFGNANFAGAIVAFFLDNTVPGTSNIFSYRVTVLCNEQNVLFVNSVNSVFTFTQGVVVYRDIRTLCGQWLQFC